MRGLGVIALLPALAVTLTACEQPYDAFACPAIGYVSTVHVTLAEPRPEATLELCGGEGCEPAAAMSPGAEPLKRANPSEIPRATPTSPAPSAVAEVMSLTGDSTAGWDAAFLDVYPVLGYRVTDADGTVIAAGHVGVEWTRDGGIEECGGPMAAEVELAVS